MEKVFHFAGGCSIMLLKLLPNARPGGLRVRRGEMTGWPKLSV
jgi:hypothetical protein